MSLYELSIWINTHYLRHILVSEGLFNIIATSGSSPRDNTKLKGSSLWRVLLNWWSFRPINDQKMQWVKMDEMDVSGWMCMEAAESGRKWFKVNESG